MAESSSNDFEHGNPTKRVITSRKLHQKKEQDRYENGERKTTAEYGKFHIFNSYPNNNNPAQQEDNHLVPDIPENKESHPTSSNQCLAPDDVKNSRFEIHNLSSGEAKRKGSERHGLLKRCKDLSHGAWLGTEQLVTQTEIS